MGYRVRAKVLFFVIVPLAACAAAAYFFFFTTRGGVFIARAAIAKFGRAETVGFEDAAGSIMDTFSLKNVSAAGLKELPPGSTIAVRQMDIRFMRFGIDGFHVRVSGGSLLLPTSESVLFYGDYSAGLLDFSVYSRKVALESLIAFFGLTSPPVRLTGRLSQIDLAVKGELRRIVLKGTLTADTLEYEGFSLVAAPIACDLVFTDPAGNVRADGNVVIRTGAVSGRKTAVIALDESRLVFSGDLSKPRLDVKGSAVVEGVKIRVSATGMFDAPDIQLFSDPFLPQEQLLVMLATGKKWAGVGTAFGTGKVSSDLALDFFDYFVLGGSGSRIARKFGITGLSVTLDETKKGVGVTGAVSDRLEVGYGVTQTQGNETQSEITTKLSGELKVTETVSVGVEKEIKHTPAAEGPASDQATNDTVMIKFKKRF